MIKRLKDDVPVGDGDAADENRLMGDLISQLGKLDIGSEAYKQVYHALTTKFPSTLKNIIAPQSERGNQQSNYRIKDYAPNSELLKLPPAIPDSVFPRDHCYYCMTQGCQRKSCPRIEEDLKKGWILLEGTVAPKTVPDEACLAVFGL